MPVRSVLAVLCATALTAAPSVVAAEAGAPGDDNRPPSASLAPAAPDGFNDSVVGHVELPTGLTWTPDGRMLAISKPGRVYVVEGRSSNKLALDITGRICSEKELGLVGIAVDPNFATNHFVYLYYTRHGGGTCTAQGGSNLSNRVGRFVLGDDNKLTSEQVIVDNIETAEAHHVAGDLEFGANGYLYISVGDGVCTVVGARKCGPLNNNSQIRRVPNGKILRVDRNGRPPADNPYAGLRGSRRCTNPAGVPGGKGPCKEIFALGFRNPFRFARKPGTNLFYVNDVGLHTWEEVNRLARGKNYGWNAREGHCARDSATNCGSVAPYRNPIHDYKHTTECRSITGGAFVPQGLWPGFDGAYLYADYSCGRMWKLVKTAPGTYKRSRFMSGIAGPVHLRFGPHGASQALYYASLNDSTIHRVALASTNTAPEADFSYTPDGRVLTFDGGASRDPDNGDRVVRWHWDFGDDTSTTTTGPDVTHTYAARQPYDVTLTVTDSRAQRSEPVTKTVHSGEHPPDITITAPDPAARFAVGQSFTLSASATDQEDGTLGGRSISWTVKREHANHFHTFTGPVSGRSLTRTFPGPEDLGAAADSRLVAYATATDSNGLQTTVEQNLEPRLVGLRFATRPRGGRVVVEGTSHRTPVVLTSWVGHPVPVEAPDQRINGNRYVFARWSDGKRRRHTIVSPTIRTTYVATFSRR